jgi:tyrosinase
VPYNDLNSSDASRNYWTKTTFADFSSAAEKIPHNALHNDVGGDSETSDGQSNAYFGFDMATVALAPRDPIFWVHHAEIDRIWYSWTKAGGEVPATGQWLDKTYYFVDGQGKLVSMMGRDVLDIGPLGYSYDEVIPKPTVALTRPQPKEKAAVSTATANNSTLTGRSTTFRLSSVSGAPIALRQEAPPTQRTWTLTLSNLTPSRTISANLDVFLNLPPDVTGGQKAKYLAGTIPLFGFAADDSTHGSMNSMVERFDISELVRELQEAGKWTGPPMVTIIVRSGSLKGGSIQFGTVSITSR